MSSEPTAPLFGLTDDADGFVKAGFDYVVIGGGTAGLVVANRLSEDASVRVGVIEAGELRLNDPLIDTPRFFSQTIANPAYDWTFMTVPQENVANRVMIQPRGKVLGGSSALNFFVLHRASKEEYDAWQELGAGEGWNWDSLLPYFKKSETVIPSEPGQHPGILTPAGLDDGAHGREGPIQVTYNNYQTDLDEPLLRAFEKMGIPLNTNPARLRHPLRGGGKGTGSFDVPRSVELHSGSRSYSANAYFLPVRHRPNLVVLTGAMVTKINFAPLEDGGKLRAASVAFTKAGREYVVEVSKEVILSAGAIQSPQLLELSGIGNASLLKKHGITPLIDNPAVGENFQDHLLIITPFLLNKEASKLVTLARLLTDSEFAAEQKELHKKQGKGAYTHATSLLAFTPLESLIPPAEKERLIRQLEQYLAESAENMVPFERSQAKISLDFLKKGEIAQVEFTAVPGELANPAEPETSEVIFPFISFGSRLFSHGSVHISSNDPAKYPAIDPRYLSNPFDKDVMILGMRSLLRMTSQEPLQSLIREPVGLTFEATDEEIENHVLKFLSTSFHPIGTASLGREGHGGVVDENLVVYGTSNLRVVDASVMPSHIAAHIQATVYAIAEKAASIIKGADI